MGGVPRVRLTVGRGGPGARAGGLRRSRRACIAAVALFLAAWAVGQPAVAQSGGGPGAGAGPERRGNMAIVRPEARMLAVTGRAGLLGFLGHDHAVTAGAWSAELCWPQGAPTEAFVDVVVPTASVRIDTELGRRLAGLDAGPDADTVADLQARMLGPDFLDARGHPELRFSSTAVRVADDAGDDGAANGTRLRVEGELTLRGRTVAVAFPARIVRASTGAFTFSARTTLRMTAFGMTPENTAGIVAVADEVELRVAFVAHRTRATCGG